MKEDKNESEAGINRRRFMMAGAGALAGTMALPEKSEASHSWGRRRTAPEPKPIVGGINPAPPDATEPLPAPYDFIHWYASGPVDTFTPFTGIPLFGLDYDPLTIGDFTGHVAYAYLDGKAKGSDGEMYDMEVDLRVYDGKYVDRDGEVNYATFALI